MDGLPLDKEYLESDLPPCLQKSILKMQDAWKKINKGESYSLFDCDYCELQSEINIAEVNNDISSRQAWYLREKYLGLDGSNEL